MNISNAILSDEHRLITSPIEKDVATVSVQGGSTRRRVIPSALQLRLSGSDDEEDSSECSSGTEDDEEDSLSSGGEEEQEDDEPLDVSPSPSLRTVRLPSAFSHALVLDRRVSSASQRSPQHMSPAQPVSSSMVHSWATDDNNNNGAQRLRSNSDATQPHLSSVRAGKTRPTPMQIDTSRHVGLTPRIEIEQVFDSDEGEQVEEEQHNDHTSARDVARTHMMQTIVGRKRVPMLRRSESMEEVTCTISNSDEKPSQGALLGVNSTSTPSPRTPGTAAFQAHHQRSISCPTPNSPQLHQFGSVQVVITPPTPRPQGSPIIGVFIRGVHRKPVINRTPSTHFCTYDADSAATSPSTCCTRAEAASLLPPAFELAPGRTKLMEAQRIQAMAMIAWQHRQQQSILQNHNWSTTIYVPQQQQQADGDVMAASPTLLPGTPGAPSMVHVQEMRAMQQRHRQSKQQHQQAAKKVFLHLPASASSATSNTASRSSTSWWREPQSAPSVWSGSSASAYSSLGSAATTNAVSLPLSTSSYEAAGAQTSSATASAADRATSWRRRDSNDETSSHDSNDSDSDDSCCAKVSSAPPPLTSYAMRNSTGKPSARAYVPPAKRVTFAQPAVHPRHQLQQQQHESGVMGRKEGVAAAALAKTRCLIPTAASTTAAADVAPNAASQDGSVRSRAAQSMLARISSRTANVTVDA